MTQLSYFQIAGKVIDATLTNIASKRGVSRDSLYRDLIKHLANNSAEWYKDRQPKIPYEDPICRLAYLYGATPVNAALVEQIFSEDTELSTYVEQVLTEKEELKVCVFGGGPGTELLGMARWIEERKFAASVDIEFLLLDRVNEWADSWIALRDKINKYYKDVYKSKSKWPVRWNPNFVPVDITDTTRFGNLGNLFGQDLYIFCYVLSEIYDNQENLRDFTSQMVAHAPAKSKFLFIDRMELNKNGIPRWLQEVTNLANEANIKLAPHYYPMQNGKMNDLDSPTDLGQIYRDVKGYVAKHRTTHKGEPRTHWDAFRIIGTKDDSN